MPRRRCYPSGWCRRACKLDVEGACRSRVLAAATELTGDAKRAAFLIRNEPLKAFGFKTCDVLIQKGRTDDLIRYLGSFAGGAAG